MDYQQLKQKHGSDPHELVHVFDELGLGQADQLRLLLANFNEAPSYAALMYVSDLYLHGSLELRRQILTAYRAYLTAGRDEEAEQVLYSLWCDFFEDPEKVDEAWHALVGPGAAPLLLRRVLPYAGPVPWPLKRSLLHDLTADPSWHHTIFACLLHSKYDYYGQIDVPEARRLLARLRLPPDTPHLAKLRSEVTENQQ